MNAREHVIVSVATTTTAVFVMKTAGIMQISDETFITGLAITASPISTYHTASYLPKIH